MIGSRVSRRYAKALLSLGQEDGRYEEYGRNLQEFSDFCKKNKDFFQVISNRLFSAEDRKKILDVVLQKTTFSDTVKNFLRLLIDKNRVSGIHELKDYYLKLTDELSDVSRAEIITARPLKKEVVDRLEKALSGLTSKKVITEVKEDGSLIGGLVVKIGDLVLDGSVKAQLAGLRASLTH